MIERPSKRSRPDVHVRRWGAALLVWVAVAGLATVAVSRGSLTERLRATLREADREMDVGNLERAGVLYRQALDASAGLGETSLPLARALDGVADVHRLAGRPAEAVPLYARSAAMWETLLGERQPRLATALHNLGATYLALGRPDLAIPRLGRALAIWEATLGPDSPEACNTRLLLRRAERIASPSDD